MVKFHLPSRKVSSAIIRRIRVCVELHVRLGESLSGEKCSLGLLKPSKAMSFFLPQNLTLSPKPYVLLIPKPQNRPIMTTLQSRAVPTQPPEVCTFNPPYLPSLGSKLGFGVQEIRGGPNSKARLQGTVFDYQDLAEA